jgi:hypothetical protein
MNLCSRSAQRTAVKQRPHQQNGRCQVATSEPVVLHHGREGGGDSCEEARPSASTACWAASAKGIVAASVDRFSDCARFTEFNFAIRQSTLEISNLFSGDGGAEG